MLSLLYFFYTPYPIKLTAVTFSNTFSLWFNNRAFHRSLVNIILSYFLKRILTHDTVSVFCLPSLYRMMPLKDLSAPETMDEAFKI